MRFECLIEITVAWTVKKLNNLFWELANCFQHKKKQPQICTLITAENIYYKTYQIQVYDVSTEIFHELFSSNISTEIFHQIFWMRRGSQTPLKSQNLRYIYLQI